MKKLEGKVVCVTGGTRSIGRGIAADVPGLYFVGLNFLYAFSSTMIHGVSRDAERIASAIAARRSAAAGSARRTTISSDARLAARA